jgi:hypothetical protein
MINGFRPTDQSHHLNGCRHSGYYSGLGLYVKESQVLRYVLVCDDCGEEMKEISALDYVPEPVLEIS